MSPGLHAVTSFRRWCHYIYVQWLVLLDDIITIRNVRRADRRGTEARALRAVEDKRDQRRAK